MPNPDGFITKAGRQLTVVQNRFNLLKQAGPRLGYLGGHNAGNLGDDAIYEAAAELMPRAHIMSYLDPHQECRYAKLGLAGRRYFHSVILGGGTLINPYWYWIDQAKIALEQGLPMWALGTGVGSFGFEMEREVDLREWAKLLANFKGVGVRGPRSKAALDALGVANVEIVGDLALQLAAAKPLAPSNPPSVAVNLSLHKMEDYGKGDYALLPEVEVVLKTLIADGWSVVPVIMHEIDIPPTKHLLEQVGMGRLPLKVLTTTKEFFSLVAPCTFTIAVRLHTSVLSCCVGVPPLMLGYRDKCLDYMESMGIEEWNVELHTAKSGEITEKSNRLANGAVSRDEVLGSANKWKARLGQYAETMLSTR